MGVFDRQTEQATRQIKAKGEVCTWKSAGVATVADASKPWIKADAATVDHTVSILWVTDGKQFAELTEGAVEAGGEFGLMHAVDFTPDLKDTIVTSDGTKRQIERMKPFKPNGTPIIWKLMVKR